MSPLRVAVVLALTLISCSPPPPTGCSSDAECSSGQQCIDRACVAALMPNTECDPGETRPCGNPAVGACKPGVQRCVNGSFETTCPGEVQAAIETCNSIDDDCDGEIDEGLTRDWYIDADGDGYGAKNAPPLSACFTPNGTSLNAVDCNDNAASVHPDAVEVCDAAGVDENCNGMVNEGVQSAWYTDADGDGFGATGSTPELACTAPMGRVMNSSDCNDTLAAVHPGATEVCDANNTDENCDGTANAGCVCVPGMMMACCGGRGAQTCDATATYSVCSASIATESCNAIDDDCDGQVDETFTLPGDGGVFELDGGSGQGDGGCSVGLGECARRGVVQCNGGVLDCGATAAAPGVETCNGRDDDCDGETDEGTAQVDCVPDSDGDTYGDSAVVSRQCVVAARLLRYGGCPVGFALPGSFDCDPNDPTLFQSVNTQPDADNDGVCVTTTRPLRQCIGATPPPGRRLATACPIATDCNDADAMVYRSLSLRVDADRDTACVGTANNFCVGATFSNTSRETSTCAQLDDCNDADGTLFRSLLVRDDQDGDDWCSGSVRTQCAGSSPAPGTLEASSCAGDDCKDNNALATNVCSMPGQYTTTTATIACPTGGPQDRGVIAATTCPAGFRLNSFTARVASGSGSCAALTATLMRISCPNFFLPLTCQITGECVAQ